MAGYGWDPGKNDRLMRERGVGFEDAVLAIEQGRLLDVLQHPNQTRYRHQRVFVVEIRCYAYLVPFVDHGPAVFLKTIIPSRKMTKRYLNRRG